MGRPGRRDVANVPNFSTSQNVLPNLIACTSRDVAKPTFWPTPSGKLHVRP